MTVKKILFIDDDPDFIDACRNLLESAGYRTDFSSDENKAMEKIVSFKPDLIFLDVVMKSERSGFSLADKIAENPETASTPVVFITGYFKKSELDDKEIKITAKWKNVKNVLDKPVKPGALLKVIKETEPL